jgi:hypothetical protein
LARGNHTLRCLRRRFLPISVDAQGGWMPRMIRRLVTVVVAVSAVAVLVPGSVGADVNLLDEQAALRIDNLPTDAPCVKNALTVSVQDNVDASSTDGVYFDLATLDVCTTPNIVLAEYDSPNPSPTPIGEDAFTVSPGNDVGTLSATLPAFEFPGFLTSITFDLQWITGLGVNSKPIQVLGTVSVPGLTLHLDDTIGWNNWGSSAGFPWAGMWLCHWAGPEGGCATQAPPLSRRPAGE